MTVNRRSVPYYRGYMGFPSAVIMILENANAESIDCFHMDALSSAVPLKIDTDLQFTVMPARCSACWPAASATATSVCAPAS